MGSATRPATIRAAAWIWCPPGAIERVAGIESPNCSGEVLAVPGDPDGSLIMRKLGAEPPCGAQMPLGRELDIESQACISEWIETMSPAQVGE